MYASSECSGDSELSLLDNAISTKTSSPKVIKLEYSLELKIKHNDWMLADTCPQEANHRALF